MTLKVDNWYDAGKQPKEPPDANYPNGMVIDRSMGAEKKCEVDLPYPAKRIGHYLCVCDECNMRIVISTAGRKDDPKKLIVACKTAAGAYDPSLRE